MTERNIKDDPRPGDRVRLIHAHSGGTARQVHVLAVTPTSVFYAEGYTGQGTVRNWLPRSEWRARAEPCA